MKERIQETGNKRKKAAIVTVSILTIMLLSGIVAYIKHVSEQETITSVIGGADGPTAILVAGTLGEGWMLPVAIGILAILVVVLLRKKINK